MGCKEYDCLGEERPQNIDKPGKAMLKLQDKCGLAMLGGTDTSGSTSLEQVFDSVDLQQECKELLIGGNRRALDYVLNRPWQLSRNVSAQNLGSRAYAAYRVLNQNCSQSCHGFWLAHDLCGPHKNPIHI